MASTFRPEIAGLRAVAVVAVILFHLKIKGFQGGFIGVDVFFVISGYLITRNILRDVRSDQFSFGQFYVRRSRRIYPALIATVVAAYCAGALWCSPLMFLDIAKECTHALLSIANIQYWRESHNYFAPNSDELALLHCWSLSLEEQFYLAWPVIIVWAYKFGRLREVIFIATAVSFVASVAFIHFDPSAVFFLTPFRIFEFGCGAIVLFLEDLPQSRTVREVLSGAGTISVVSSGFLLTPDLPYLEFATLLPCLGASAVIIAGSNTFSSRLTTHSVAIGLGAISYSLYLCHWPIIFFARFIFGPDADSPHGILLMLAAMFVVGPLMYRYIEQQFNLPSESAPVNVWNYAAGFWSIVLTLVTITHATFLLKGLDWRLSPERAALAHLQELSSGSDVELATGPFAMQLVGDSHAIQYMAGLSPVMKRLGIKMKFAAHPGCLILYGVALKKNDRDYAHCVKDQPHALEEIRRTNLPMIYVQRWDNYDDATIDDEFDAENDSHFQKHSFTKLQRALERSIGQFVENGRHILIIGRQVEASCSINLPRMLDGPLEHAPPAPCAPVAHETVEQSGANLNQMLARIQAKWPDRIELLRPDEYFCDAECPTVKDGIWLYRDRNHFTVAGSKYMVSRAEVPINEFLTKTLTRISDRE